MNKLYSLSEKIHSKTVTAFLLSIIIFLSAGFLAIRNKINIETLEMEGIIHETAFRIKENVSKQLYQTKALAALVIQGDGIVYKFDETVAVITADMPALANFLLAPDGVVTHVYPLEGNEAVLGLNFFNEPEHPGNKEAIIARDTGNLVMAGPFMLRQGIVGLVGRYPVYLEPQDGQPRFWGLVSVSLRFPEALDDAGLSLLEHKGYSYELWRINPDTNEKQVIASSGEHLSDNVPFVQRTMVIHNARWYLKMFPIRAWYHHPESWLLIFAGLSISSLIAALVQKNIILKSVMKKTQADSRIAIMLSQIKPHFLYNALTAITQLCEEDPPNAKKTIIDFSQYLRNNMQSLSNEGLITAREELNHVKSYLNLEKAIYSNALNIIYNIENDGFMLPPLTVQPIAENAVKHGIGKKEGGGTVTISVKESTCEYLIYVSDDAMGFNVGDNKEHIGLSNVRKRLAEQCGGSLEILSVIGTGTTVTIRIPKEKS
jgi:hypothetical protein